MPCIVEDHVRHGTTTHGMIEGHRLHQSQIDGLGVEPAGAFAVSRCAGPEGITVMALSGELDIAAAPALRSQVDEAAGERAVVLDLSGATFVDSSMLKELLRASAELARYDVELVLAGVPPVVQRLLDLTRTTSLFTLAGDREAALRALAP
jgi:anti-anti-sigma factor